MSKKMSEQKKGWRDLPIGGMILEAGNSAEYDTGGWRTFYPVHDPEKCTNCLLCWIYCPDSAIRVKEGKFLEFDLKHCKGCGICAEECPDKIQAISMAEERK